MQKKMDDYLLRQKYIPTKEYFVEPKNTGLGFFMSPGSTDQSEASNALDMMVSDVVEMEELIKNNFLQSEVKKKEFFDNNPEQKTLRKQIQDL